ncbi:hypothetical protein [Leptothoe spongobia]|uniref:N-acetyltransferase domain-containing protein n=1 Tax=Leptothoe spongobia TAU-MAC 1115 TaxID=1967444 RepID=A0A947DCI0_9CYAN|nr:hypothetical protein [Leptothoe spongobia]MBT9313889.1 hypothetical protein [Leptothoe spongobia TAU-MAC 1115]
MSTFSIKPITTADEQAAFIAVPAYVYRDNPHWVAPIESSIAKQFAAENSFFQYGKLQQFLAYQGDQPVGRVVAAVNDRLIEREGISIGLIGFFECIDNIEIGQALLNAAADWLQQQGMTHARGPIDLSTHNNCCFLVDGFDSDPMLMMPYNPQYYLDIMEANGWQKAKDAYAYDLPLDHPLPNSFERGYKIAQKAGITFRSIHTKGEAFDQDCRQIYELFTTAFAHNWSSSARTEEEFMFEARELQTLVDTDIFVIAEDPKKDSDNKMVGFFMALPDYNIALKQVKGKLNIFGILKFLWYRRKIDQARVLAICTLPEYSRRMVALAVVYLGMKGGTEKKRPYKRSELSWVYEDNMRSRNIIESTGATIYKTYRIYEKALT